MKITKENIKKNYLLFIIKSLVLIFFIFALIRGEIETSIYWNFIAETDGGLQNYLNVLKETTYFRPAIILLIPLTGIFINKKIGWILISSYFYFLLTRVVFSNISNVINYDQEILYSSIILIISVLFIWIMNRKKIISEFYTIEKNEFLISNIKASSIGILITLFMVLVN